MYAHGRAARAASIVGALLALLVTHSAAADDVMVVYGKRVAEKLANNPTQMSLDAEEIRVALHDDIRAALRETVRSLRTEIDSNAAAREVRVAALETSPDA